MTRHSFIAYNQSLLSPWRLSFLVLKRPDISKCYKHSLELCFLKSYVKQNHRGKVMLSFLKLFTVLILSSFVISSAHSLTMKDIMRLLYPPVSLFEEEKDSRVFERHFIHNRPHASVTQFHFAQTGIFFEIQLPDEDPQLGAPDVPENLTLNLTHQGQSVEIWQISDYLKLCGKGDLNSLTLEDLKLCLETLLKSLPEQLPNKDMVIKALQTLINIIITQLAPIQAPVVNFGGGLFDDVQNNATAPLQQESAEGPDLDGDLFSTDSIFGGSSLFIGGASSSK
jgi:hypothetical protein